MSQLLEMRGIGKSFPGVRALDGVDFAVGCGEVHALMGENGAGKSTLIKVLTGVYRRDEGEVLLDGQSIDPRSPQESQTMGISTVYQEVNLIPHLSVAENLFLGREPVRWGRIDWKQVNRGASEAMERLGVEIDVSRTLASYSIAIQQMVAIARALDVSAKLLILDEPTSSLDAGEVERLFAVIRRLKAQGLGIVFITHFLDQVYAIADRITILRNGSRVGEFEAASLSKLDLVARMIGKAPEEVEAMGHRVPSSQTNDGREPLVCVRNLGKRGAIHPFDLDIFPGEAIGLAGLLGSGRTECARLIFGADKPDQGQVSIGGKRIRLSNPRSAIAQGFALCPEDRKTDGIIPDLSVRENIVIALQARRGMLRRLSAQKQQELASEYIRALSIATPDADKPIKELSGGNQQKAILARWLASDPELLILDEPTRGIDVGAKAEIADLIADLCAKGMATLFISSELDEVVRTCSRVAVLRDRVKIGELSGTEVDESTIVHTIAKGYVDG